MFPDDNPGLRRAVRRYVKRLYYCTNLEHPLEKEHVCYERELTKKRGGTTVIGEWRTKVYNRFLPTSRIF